MDIESIKKIVDFFDKEVREKEINLIISLPALVHRNLQKQIWEIGNKEQPLEYSDEFNLNIEKITFTFIIKK
tara:strand:+ start:7690 stop:7905 length:216 start_codon:yes stop_codon:yes gene_type:complete